jgi:hypothetical protein
MNLLETHMRAFLVNDLLSVAFVQLGFKTEGRLLRVQSSEVIDLVKKAWRESQFESSKALYILAGSEAEKSYREKRRKRGGYYGQIGAAEKRMLKTMRKASDSLYKEHSRWSRRKQIEATKMMMSALMGVPRERAKKLLSADPSK